jgi:ethanolamine-phosphate phospho-lyase
MESLLSAHYNIDQATLLKMEGYISTNYKVESKQGIFVLKVYPVEVREEILAETDLIERLEHLDGKSVSIPIKNNRGETITLVEIDNEPKYLRLLSFVDGVFLAEAPHTMALFHSLGQFMAKIDQSLLGFRSAGIAARKLDWDLQHINHCRPLKEHITNPSDRKIVDHYFIQWDEHVYPKLAGLRQSIIHNDANDWNVLVKEDRVSGIIDFGDAVHTPLINELAIAITYCAFGKEDPLLWAQPVIKGYVELLPLLKEELDVLYYLIAGRLVTSVCKSANEKRLKPDNEYITISERPAWELLRKWIKINPIDAKNQFYLAAGFNIAPQQAIEQVLDRRLKSLSPILSVSYKKPIFMESAAFQYMFDKYGNTYLDAYNNIPHVGHQHPKVVERGRSQMTKLNTNTRYLYDQLQEYAEKLLAKFPSPLNKVYFVNSGSAASDLAVRLAQNYTQKHKMVVMEHGYHGNTRMGIDVSAYKYKSKGGKGKADYIIEAPIPDTYRGIYKNDNGEAGLLYAKGVIGQIAQAEGGVAGFIAEPIIGCGGQVPLAKDYLKHIYPAVRDQGGLCISDEVQTGFGRMGSHFWGFEMQEVIPDIVVLGKPIANGHPMGAVVTSTPIAEAFNNGMEFFSSFGGNPVSCAIASAVLEVIEEEELQKNSLEVGDYFMRELKSLQKQYATIGDIRGSGLFLGIEFIKDDELTPNTALAGLIKNELRNRNILVSTDGPYESVIKSKPPLCFSKENVDQVIAEMDSILR